MTAYTWSTFSADQALTFTGSDTLTFDGAGSTARNVTVVSGATSTTLSYLGRTVTVNNTAFTGAAGM